MQTNPLSVASPANYFLPFCGLSFYVCLLFWQSRTVARQAPLSMPYNMWDPGSPTHPGTEPAPLYWQCSVLTTTHGEAPAVFVYGSFAVQKLLHLIRSHLFILVFISVTLADGFIKILLQFMSVFFLFSSKFYRIQAYI